MKKLLGLLVVGFALSTVAHANEAAPEAKKEVKAKKAKKEAAKEGEAAHAEEKK